MEVIFLLIIIGCFFAAVTLKTRSGIRASVIVFALAFALYASIELLSGVANSKDPDHIPNYDAIKPAFPAFLFSTPILALAAWLRLRKSA